MLRSKVLSWSTFSGTLVLLGALTVAMHFISVQGAEPTTAAPGGPVPAARATVIAQKTEQLHLAHAKTAAEEDEAVLSDGNPPTSLSPEKATEVVQKSGLLGSGQVSSVTLTATSSGRPVYEVRASGSNAAIFLVDAQTGALVTPSFSVH